LDAGDPWVPASTVSRRLSVVGGFYRTCVIDGILDHSPADDVRRPPGPQESPTFGLTHLQFEAMLHASRESTNPTRRLRRQLRDEGLLLPAHYQRERRKLAERRKAAFATEPTGPNQVWQRAGKAAAGGGRSAVVVRAVFKIIVRKRLYWSAGAPGRIRTCDTRFRKGSLHGVMALTSALWPRRMHLWSPGVALVRRDFIPTDIPTGRLSQGWFSPSATEAASGQSCVQA